MPMKFETGMGVIWHDDEDVFYGVVMSERAGCLDLVPVFGLSNDMRCYDEGGSRRDRDADNVMLRDCPPPFTLLCAFAERSGCYAYADPDARLMMSSDDVLSYGVSIVDDGAKISGRDMSEILDHPWRDEKEFGFSGSKVDSEPVQPKRAASAAMDRLLAAISDNGDISREDGFDEPDY